MAHCHHPGQAEVGLLPKATCLDSEKGFKGQTLSVGQGTQWALMAPFHKDTSFPVYGIWTLHPPYSTSGAQTSSICMTLLETQNL